MCVFVCVYVCVSVRAYIYIYIYITEDIWADIGIYMPIRSQMCVSVWVCVVMLDSGDSYLFLLFDTSFSAEQSINKINHF